MDWEHQGGRFRGAFSRTRFQHKKKVQHKTTYKDRQAQGDKMFSDTPLHNLQGDQGIVLAGMIQRRGEWIVLLRGVQQVGLPQWQVIEQSSEEGQQGKHRLFAGLSEQQEIPPWQHFQLEGWKPGSSERRTWTFSCHASHD